MIETSNSTATIDAAILAIQQKAPVIRKKADNPYFKSKYAEYPEIQAEIRPLLLEQSIITMFFPVANNQLIMNVKHTASKEFYRVTMDLKTIQDSPQAQGSAITYGKRYMLTAFFDLQIEDASDDDGNAGSNAKPKQQTQQQTNQAAALTPPAEDKRTWLNPDTQLWFDTKNWLFEKDSRNITAVNKKYRITQNNAEMLAKQEVLKPGAKLWDIAAKFLSKEGAKAENIKKMFIITEDDLTDLQIDATNIETAPPAEPLTETNTTK